ncbi:hypothetical protein [Salinispora arenicola]|uniref:hypothetical protein n=1 Tax=Salinispora arenicola TaxID=168697 RepID=UPI0016B231BA|nr:hypothetical protein [Salinispora arenicola]NIL64968.1 hypothetical protein [Salinispora arenicola]
MQESGEHGFRFAGQALTGDENFGELGVTASQRSEAKWPHFMPWLAFVGEPEPTTITAAGTSECWARIAAQADSSAPTSAAVEMSC